jgi:recombination protein RecR
LASGEIKEVIFALSGTIEGDTTSFYIYKKIKAFNIAVSTIARGISVGDEIEYADEITLGRSITNRMPYQDGLEK